MAESGEGYEVDTQGRLITGPVRWEGPDGGTVIGVLVEWHTGSVRHTAIHQGSVDGPVAFDTSAYPELCTGHAQPLRSAGVRERGAHVLKTLSYSDGTPVFAAWFDIRGDNL